MKDYRLGEVGEGRGALRDRRIQKGERGGVCRDFRLFEGHIYAALPRAFVFRVVDCEGSEGERRRQEESTI